LLRPQEGKLSSAATNPPHNIALNKPAIQISTSEWSRHFMRERDAATAVSGKIEGNEFFHTGAAIAPWWQVDLGDFFWINGLECFLRKDIPRTYNHTVVRSIDGVHWENLGALRAAPHQTTIDPDWHIKLENERLARYVRVYERSYGYLYFRQLRVFGRMPSPDRLPEIVGAEALHIADRFKVPDGRLGRMIPVWPFMVFADTRAYEPDIVDSLETGSYERSERELTARLLSPGNRVIEIGTAAGIVAMTAAMIVGAENVRSFEANAEIAADAKANFLRNELEEITLKVGALRNRHAIGLNGTSELDFFIHKSFWASTVDAARYEHGVVRSIKVPVFCLEDEIADHGADVIISDIEGAEFELFEEADLAAINLLIMEVHFFRGAEAVSRFMTKMIYKGFDLNTRWSSGEIMVFSRRHS